ncbi:MAG: hypothetical protein JO244_12535 [Solirubrobacterales bacterium]|nr:hypothetical protein [Solirubrobacterales bacterium]
MRRLAIIGTAIAVLGAAAAAYAASNYNNYSGSNLKISASKKGALSLVETLKASAPGSDRAAPLQDIKYKIYGVKLDTGKLPVCTDSKIESNKTNPDGGCSPGSLIGNGPTHSVLGSGTDPTAPGTPCKPYLHIFNGGPKTQVEFFYTKSATDCGGLTTGATAPFDGHISYAGGYAVIDVPQPPDISTNVAGLPNYYGSLIAAAYSFGKTVNGKPYMTSVACKGGKRPWSITYTDQKYNGGGSETSTVKGSSKC